VLADEHWPWLLVASSLAVLHLLSRRVMTRDDTKSLQRVASRAWLNILDWAVGIVLLLLGLLAMALDSLSAGFGPILVGAVEVAIAIDRRAHIRRAREILAQAG
jgi:hypothetical protein